MRFIGDKGRKVITEIYPPLTPAKGDEREIENLPKPATANLPVTQSVVHRGEPMAIAAYDVPALVNLARQADGLIIMPFAVGDVIIEGETLLTVHGGRPKFSQPALRQAVQLEQQRTFEQDPKYALRLLVDIAIKALSPAVNDPTTAVQALNQIEDLLRRLSTRDLEVGQVRDETGVLRLIFPTPTWEDFLMLAFDEIRVIWDYLSPGHAPIAHGLVRSRPRRAASATKGTSALHRAFGYHRKALNYGWQKIRPPLCSKIGKD